MIYPVPSFNLLEHPVWFMLLLLVPMAFMLFSICMAVLAVRRLQEERPKACVLLFLLAASPWPFFIAAVAAIIRSTMDGGV